MRDLTPTWDAYNRSMRYDTIRLGHEAIKQTLDKVLGLGLS